MSADRPSRVLFVTGKLAEPALRRTLADFAPAAGIEADVAVLPITVAALLTPNWVARHLSVPDGSVNGTNLDHAHRWRDRSAGVEVVAIPDTPTDLDSLDRTVQQLAAWGVRFRVDPILEPIGFGFAASLGRYVEVRKRYPDAALMMGIGNLTELTDVDSAGVNVMLAGFCQELGIGSVLTTEVISWCRSA